MMCSDSISRARTLGSAIESDDVPTVEAAIQDYVAWFHSGERTLAEVAHARDLFTSSAQTVHARKRRIADELGRLTTISGGYRSPRISSTWNVNL